MAYVGTSPKNLSVSATEDLNRLSAPALRRLAGILNKLPSGAQTAKALAREDPRDFIRDVLGVKPGAFGPMSTPHGRLSVAEW